MNIGGLEFKCHVMNLLVFSSSCSVLFLQDPGNLQSSVGCVWQGVAVQFRFSLSMSAF